MAVALSVMVIAAIGIPVVLEIVLEPSVLAKLGLGELSLPRLQGWALSFVIMFLVFALIYRLAPYVPVGWRDVLPGALLAAVAFELGKAAFVLYLDRFAHFESVYGPLTSIIVLLLWLYVSALILIIGAEYNIARRQAKEAVAADPQVVNPS
jgi:membrane protein